MTQISRPQAKDDPNGLNTRDCKRFSSCLLQTQEGLQNQLRRFLLTVVHEHEARLPPWLASSHAWKAAKVLWTALACNYGSMAFYVCSLHNLTPSLYVICFIFISSGRFRQSLWMP
jgi:hypothetical protein